MKPCEVIEPYFEYMGLRLRGGDTRSVIPVSIFCIHDYIYQIFNKDIKPLKLKKEGKKFKNEWDRENHLHFKKFFQAIGPENGDIIISMMDDFEDSLKNSIDLIRYSVMDCVNDVSIEYQQVIASLQVCNILSQVAQDFWMSMVKTTPQLSNKLRYNDVVRKYSSLLSDGIYRGGGGKQLNKKRYDNLLNCIRAFCNELVDWVNSRSEDIEVD